MARKYSESEGMHSEFASLLRRLRKGRFTQKQVLKRLRGEGYAKYSEADISKWEHGRRIPPEDVVEALEDILLADQDGSLLKAAGYFTAAASKSETHKLRNLAAWSRHVDGMVEVAQSLRYNLVVPTPARAQDEEYLINPKTDAGKSGLEAAQAELKATFINVRPGPKWYPREDGSLEIGFYTEDFPLFAGFMEHLGGTGVDSLFEELKDVLKEYIEACRDMKEKVSGDDLLSVTVIATLYQRSEMLAAKLAKKLDELMLSRNLPGRCRSCPK